MGIPLRVGPGTHDETPLQEENLVTFTLRRLRRDLETGLAQALQEKVPTVILGHHTDFIDPITQAVGTRPILDPQTKSAIVPACVMTDIDITENPTDRSQAKRRERVQFVNDDQEVVMGTRVRNAPLMVDISIGVQLFHNHRIKLQSLAMAFRRFFMRHPYLVVPYDQTNRDGDLSESADELAHRFMSGEDVSEIGLVFEQYVPFDAPFASFRTAPNRDNLYVCDTQIMIRGVPFDDEWIIGDFEDLNTITFILYDLDDPEETERSRITITTEG